MQDPDQIHCTQGETDPEIPDDTGTETGDSGEQETGSEPERCEKDREERKPNSGKLHDDPRISGPHPGRRQRPL